MKVIDRDGKGKTIGGTGICGPIRKGQCLRNNSDFNNASAATLDMTVEVNGRR